MSVKLLALCFLGLLLGGKLPYAVTVSEIAILLIVGRSTVRFVAHRRRLSRLPGPPHSFLWGHLKFLSERFEKDGDTPELFGKLQREYGPDGVLFLDTWPVMTAVCMVFDEGVAIKVQTTDNLPKALDVYHKLRTLLGPQSILTLEGDQWYKLRKMFNPAFSQGHLETLVPGIIEETLTFVKVLNDTAQRGDILLMLDALTALTFDVIGRVTLGIEFQAQHGKDAGSLVTAFLKAVKIIPVGNSISSFIINRINPFILYRHWKTHKLLNYEISTVVRSLRNRRDKKDGIAYRTVLDLAFEDEEYGSQATISELVDQVKTFLFAGHDTSASMLSWTYYYLSLHPNCLAKMREEHKEIFGPITEPAAIAEKIASDPKLLRKLDYTTAALRESLRLRPIGDGVRLSPPGYIIRTATGAEFDTSNLILSNQHEGLHTKEEVWGPTATEFNPDRFIPGKSIPIGYMPFATRPRDCIGRNLAYLEGKIVLALTIGYFDFHHVKVLHQIYKGTKKPSDGAPMRVTRAAR